MSPEPKADLSRPRLRNLGVGLFASVVLTLALTSIANGGGGQAVRAHGVALTVPAGWHRVTPAGDGPVTDPRTLLVVGTTGVAPKPTQCQIAAYRVPAHGAVVVIVGWKSATSGGGRIKPGRRPLKVLTSVKRRSFECFAGRGAVASLVLGGKAYQVNVMVGNSTSAQHVAEPLRLPARFVSRPNERNAACPVFRTGAHLSPLGGGLSASDMPAYANGQPFPSTLAWASVRECPLSDHISVSTLRSSGV
jgi:hypothetical protein